jgi:HSP20 family protein
MIVKELSIMTDLTPFKRKKSGLINMDFSDFHNMLDEFFTEGLPLNSSLSGDTFKVDLHQDDKNYYIEAELPGIEKDEIKVAIDDCNLQISIKRNENAEKAHKNYIHRERRCTSMERSIYLADADAANTKAKLENGVLNMIIPKNRKKDNSMRINIE